MTLYTVHFSTLHMVSKFDSKGRKVSEYETKIPQTLTALPHATAMQYKDMPDFRMEAYQLEQRRQSPSGMKRGEFHVTKTSAGGKSKVAPKTGSKVHHAAATGDLAAAVSGVK